MSRASQRLAAHGLKGAAANFDAEGVVEAARALEEMGRIAMSKANFDLLGGYDKSRFKGWSGEDSDLLIRAVRMFMRVVFIRERRFLRVVQHSDLDECGAVAGD